MKIWAHRGCSQMYPENTLLSFSKAAGLSGLCGIELDIQLTRDGHMVVIHDEKVDRTTDSTGYVKDYSLSEIKKLKINAGNGNFETIPTIDEVFDLLDKKIKSGFRINIELKNSNTYYEGMEEKIISLVHKRGYQDSIVYSSFYAKSLELVNKLDPNAEIGILDKKASDCLYKLKGGCKAVALHPHWRFIDLSADEMKGYTVRAWFSGHLYPEKSTGVLLNLNELENKGITDVFLNEPEKYL